MNTADLKVEVNVVIWNILIFSNTCKMLSYDFFTLPSILLSNFALLVFKLRSYVIISCGLNQLLCVVCFCFIYSFSLCGLKKNL